jgi:hypothetical protein
MSKLPLVPAPQPDPAGLWCTRGALAFSLVVTEAGPAPIYRPGSTVYCSRTRRIRARGGTYILTAGTGAARRFTLLHIERATKSTLHGLLYSRKPEGGLRKEPVKLSRSKWRVAFRERGVTFPD